MGLFKDDDISGAEAFALDEDALGSFDDDNIDKDLLNQIFADDSASSNNSDDANLDIDIGSDDFYIDDNNQETKDENLVDELAEEIAEELAEEAEAAEEKVEEEVISPEETVEDVIQEVEEPVNEEVNEEPVKAAPAKATVAPASVNDDIVNDEAMRSMNEERLNGTVTVITENTTITGSISSDGSLEVRGTITGDIDCQGKVYINGIVSGGVSAAEIYVNTPKLHGGLLSEGTVKIGVGTVVLGDVSGSSAYIAGAVCGNIDIDGPLTIESTAILKGDIKAKSININPGAVIEGYYSLYNSGINLDKFFEEEQ